MESMTLKISPKCPKCLKNNDLWMSTYVVNKIANNQNVLHICDNCGTKLNIAMNGSDFIFLYWDDPGDSQEHVDNQDADEKRMLIISQNGNTGEHYTCNKCEAPMIEVLNGVYPCDSDKCPLSADT
jgi:RNase P subunit RPR2